MSKRFTSLLFGALAAVLLGAPVQAQKLSKVGKTHSGVTTLTRLVRQAEHRSAVESPEFRKLDREQREAFEAKMEKIKDATDMLPTPQQLRRSHGSLLMQALGERQWLNSLSNGRQLTAETVKVPLRAGAAETVVNGVITVPAEGKHSFYTRTGDAFYVNSNNSLVTETQDKAGYTEIVECEDGTVYMKPFVSFFTQDSWVKGKKDGSTITFPAGQPVYYTTSYGGVTLSANWGDYTGQNCVREEGVSTVLTVDYAAGTESAHGSSFTEYPYYEMGKPEGSNFYYDADEGAMVIENTNTSGNPWDLQPFIADWFTVKQGLNYILKIEYQSSVDGAINIAFGNWNASMPMYGVPIVASDSYQTMELLFENATFGSEGDNHVLWQCRGVEGTMKIRKVEIIEVDAEKANIVFEIDGDALKLKGSSAERIVTIFWDDDNTWQGYADWNTVLTLDPTYVPAEPITPPADLETAEYYTWGDKMQDNSWATFKKTVNVGFDGNTVYVQGLFEEYPEAWIKGEIEDNIVTFEKGQFLGKYGTYDIWAMGGTISEDGQSIDVDNFYMMYDAEAQTMTALNELLANADKEKVLYLEWYSEFIISANPPAEPVAVVGDPVDELPYENGFGEDAEDLGVIDANEDNSTWGITTDDNARYSYGAGDADDWIVTPAIRLEAGVKYQFAIDTRAQSTKYPERIEVKLGTAPKASALTQEVIAPTDVDFTEWATLENNEVTVAEDGYYYFGIHAISDGDMYYLFVDNLVIDKAPVATAPAAITDLAVVSTRTNVPGAVVTFTAPTKAINGSALTSLTKIELLRDKNVVKTFEEVIPGNAITYTDMDEDLTIGLHKYQVVAYNADGAGQRSEEVQAQIICVLDVPYTANLTDESVFSLFTVIDANADGKTWVWNSKGASNTYTSAGGGNCDDYLITLPFSLKAGKKYSVVATVFGQSASYPQTFEVVVGKEATAEALNQVVIPATVIESSQPDDFEGEFTVEEDGEYFVAVHDISEEDQYYTYVSAIIVEEGLADNAPAAPRVIVQPDPYGAEKNVVTVTAPAFDISNKAITENLSKVDVLRNGVIVASFEDVEPSGINVFVDRVEAGNYSYQAIAYNADGNRGRKSAATRVSTGLDVPAAVTNITAIEAADGSVTLKWDPVSTVGDNGGVVVPADVTYGVWTYHYETVLFWDVVVLDEELASTTDTSVTLQFDPEEAQEVQSVLIIPSNQAGALEGDYASGISIFTGAPYTMPFVEHFAATGFDCENWIITESTLNSDWDLSGDASDGDGGALTFIGGASGDRMAITPGKVAVEGENPALTIDVKSDGSEKNAIIVYIQTPDGKMNYEKRFVPDTEYSTVKVPLAAYADYAFVKPIITSDFVEAGKIIIDNVQVVDLLDDNMTVSIKAPASVKCGKTAEVFVTVKNTGDAADMDDFNLKVFAGNKVIFNEKVTGPLFSMKAVPFTVTYETSIFDEAGEVTLTAEIDNMDLDLDDNKAQTVIELIQSKAEQPLNVKAQKGADAINITWDAFPEGTKETVTEDFSTYENGAYEEIGDWTVINANGGLKGGIITGLSLPYEGQPSAYMVMNPAEFDLGDIDALFGPNGTADEYYLISGYNMDESNNEVDNDDWLISPQLSGDAQKVEFYANSFVEDYKAQFEVLISKEGKETDEFTKISEFTLDQPGWSKISVNLPKGVNFFAIRNVTTGADALLFGVTNITFTKGTPKAIGFNIWANLNNEWQLVDAAAANATSFDLKGEEILAATAVAVSALYNGDESQPVVVVFGEGNKELTAIKQLLTSGKPVDVYTLDGKLVRSQTTDLNGLKGTFVIEGRKVMIK
jgi:hypothetical protein